MNFFRNRNRAPRPGSKLALETALAERTVEAVEAIARGDHYHELLRSSEALSQTLIEGLQHMLEVDPDIARFTAGVVERDEQTFILWDFPALAAAAAYRRGEAPEHKEVYERLQWAGGAAPGGSELVLDIRQKNAIMQLVGICYSAAKERGFHDRGDEIRARRDSGEGVEAWQDYTGAKLALIHSEITEALEALREGGTFNAWSFSVNLPGLDVRADDPAYVVFRRYFQPGMEVPTGNAFPTIADEDLRILVAAGYLKPEGILSELIDAIIRLFDLIGSEQADAATMFDWKLAYNATRGRMHGKRF